VTVRARGRTIAVIAVGALLAWQVVLTGWSLQVGPDLSVTPGAVVLLGFLTGLIHVVGPTALGIAMLENHQAPVLGAGFLGMLALGLRRYGRIGGLRA
jgi:hypothetical protein